jgi:hypothetical protein
MDNPHNHDTIEAIITLNSLNWSNSKISRALGIHRKKIAKILKASKNLEKTVQDSPTSDNDAPLNASVARPICLHCRECFRPDPRHVGRQKFCNKAECKAASKRHSQRKWSEKNSDYWT